MDIHEIVRLKRAGQSNAEISRLMGRRRKTIRKYVRWATEQGVLGGDPLSVEALHRLLEVTMPIPPPPKQDSSLAKHEAEIKELRAAGVEMAAIRMRLQERHEEEISYEALRRLVRRLEPRRP
jgi:predicted transcriptional regulator